MISLDEINKTILELEQHDTTYATIEKLAWLYTVRNNMVAPEKVSRSGNYNGSDFRCACSDVPMDALMEILDEHFNAIKVLYPKEYSAIIKRIKEISP